MSLRIGLEIYDALTATALPGGAEARVYPVVAPDGAVAKPFVTYTVSAVGGDYTKDGGYADHGTAKLSCVADTYAAAIELAVEARRRMECAPGVGVESMLTKSSEAYALDADAYAVDLEFSVTSAPDF